MLRLRRRIETHPEVHLAVVGYFGDRPVGDANETAPLLSYLGSSSELVAVAEERAGAHRGGAGLDPGG